MISIYFNNEIQQIEPIITLHNLLMQNNYTEQHFAVAVNDKFIPRGTYCAIFLQPGDRVDIIVPMQGG